MGQQGAQPLPAFRGVHLNNAAFRVKRHAGNPVRLAVGVFDPDSVGVELVFGFADESEFGADRKSSEVWISMRDACDVGGVGLRHINVGFC